MFLIKIQLHSFIDLITNSSTELFIVKADKTVDTIKDMIYERCEGDREKDWYDAELDIYANDDDETQITIYSFLNGPHWLEEFIYKHFTVISHD